MSVAEHAEVERAGVVGNDQQTPARSEDPAYRAQQGRRIADVLDRLDADRQIDARFGDACVVNRAMMNGEPALDGALLTKVQQFTVFLSHCSGCDITH